MPLACQSVLVRVVKSVLLPQLTLQHALLFSIPPKLLWPSTIRPQGNAGGHVRQKEILSSHPGPQLSVAAPGGHDLTVIGNMLPLILKQGLKQLICFAKLIPAKHGARYGLTILLSPRLLNGRLQKIKLVPGIHALPLLSPAMTNAPAVPLDTLHKAAKMLRPGKALDAGGWAHESMQLLRQLEFIREDILRMLAFAYGQAQHPESMSGLLAAEIIMLCKEDAGGIRPICCKRTG